MKGESREDWINKNVETLLALTRAVGTDFCRYCHGRALGATFKTPDGFGYAAFAEIGPPDMSLGSWRLVDYSVVLPTRDDAEALMFSVMKACEHGAD
jgi:hypothetical protein